VISRALLDLARQGLGFPRPDALRINREYRPQTFQTVRVHVLRAHYNAGRLLRAGETVALLEPVARDACALGRAERL
jgi:hypothetical protein